MRLSITLHELFDVDKFLVDKFGKIDYLQYIFYRKYLDDGDYLDMELTKAMEYIATLTPLLDSKGGVTDKEYNNLGMDTIMGQSTTVINIVDFGVLSDSGKLFLLERFDFLIGDVAKIKFHKQIPRSDYYITTNVFELLEYGMTKSEYYFENAIIAYTPVIQGKMMEQELIDSIPQYVPDTDFVLIKSLLYEKDES